MKFQVNVISPDKILYQGEADEIHVPGEEGGMSILANHAPVLASLKKGDILLVDGSHKTGFPVQAGFIEVSKKEQPKPGQATRFANILIRQP
jgi:F-type H+-transporting ATPase subunit epsilon